MMEFGPFGSILDPKWVNFGPLFGSILGPILGPIWGSFWGHFGALFGALRPPLLSKNTRKSNGFGAFRGLGWAPFWVPFWAPFGHILGSIWSHFGALFGSILGSVLAPFRDFQENLDFRLASRRQTPSDLVFVPGARRFLSPDPLLKDFLKNLLKDFLLKISSEKIFKP